MDLSPEISQIVSEIDAAVKAEQEIHEKLKAVTAQCEHLSTLRYNLEQEQRKAEGKIGEVTRNLHKAMGMKP